MREGMRLYKEKCERVARAQSHRLLRGEDRLVGSIEEHQNQGAQAKCQGEIWIDDDRAIDRAQCGIVLAGEKRESKASGCKHMGIIPGGCDRIPRDADSLIDLWTG